MCQFQGTYSPVSKVITGTYEAYQDWAYQEWWFYNESGDLIRHYSVKQTDCFFAGQFRIEIAGDSTSPVAAFTYSPESPGVSQVIVFDGSSSHDPDGLITRYDWDFGDGGTGSGKVANHAYDEPREYIVTLTVTDDDGLTGSTQRSVVVSRLVVTFLDRDDPTREVVGAAADGASKVTVQMSGLREDVTSDDVYIYVPTADGSLEDDAAIVDGVFTQTYVAPAYYLRDSYPEDISQGRREIDLAIRVDGQEIDHDPLYLTKVPVVLLHGLWADSGTWYALKSILETEHGYEYVV